MHEECRPRRKRQRDGAANRRSTRPGAATASAAREDYSDEHDAHSLEPARHAVLLTPRAPVRERLVDSRPFAKAIALTGIVFERIVWCL